MGLCTSLYDKYNDDTNPALKLSTTKYKKKNTTILAVGPKLELRSSEKRSTKTVLLSDKDTKIMKTTKLTKPISEFTIPIHEEEKDSKEDETKPIKDGKDQDQKFDFSREEEDELFEEIPENTGLKKAITSLDRQATHHNNTSHHNLDESVHIGAEALNNNFDSLKHMHTNLDNYLTKSQPLSSVQMEDEENFLRNYKIKCVLRDQPDRKIYEALELDSYTPVRIIQIFKFKENDKKYIIPETSSCPQMESNLKSFESPSSITIIQTYRKNSSLADIVQHVKSEKQLLYIIFQIINAVAHLHKQGIMNNKLTVDSFNVVSNFNNEFFNIKLYDYSFCIDDNSKTKSDFYDISILFYYLVIKRMPYEDLEQIKQQLESTLSRYTLSLIAKLSSTSSDITMRKLMDHKSFHICDINLSTINLLNNAEFLRSLLKNLEKNLKKEFIDDYLNKEKSKTNTNNKMEVSINFLACHILVGKNSVSLDSSRVLEQEKPLESAYSNLKENIDELVSMINKSSIDRLEINSERIITALNESDNIKSLEEVRKIVQFALEYEVVNA